MCGYIEIARIEEIPRNGMKQLNVRGLEILLLNANDRLCAVENRCPHMGYPLYLGNLEGTILTCGFHYAKFDVTTGRPLNRVTDKSLRTFKLRVHGSKVLVKL